MIRTREILDNRKSEIEFYFSVLIDINDETKNVLNSIDNQRFFRIMKSNYILMLYNLVEATITTGITEIYEKLVQENCAYDEVIDEIQQLWRDSEVKKVYKPDSTLFTYTSRVKDIVMDITQRAPIRLTRGMLNYAGNLDARRIKDICDQHRIRYRVPDDMATLEKVKKKRNSLAHGDESFSQCARDFTVNDLEVIKDNVISFIEAIVVGMENYYDQKMYLRNP